MKAQVDEIADHKAKRKIAENARLAAQKRHTRNHELKAQARIFFDEHRHEYSGLDSLATALAGIMTDVAWRTIREWFVEFNRSVSSPDQQG